MSNIHTNPQKTVPGFWARLAFAVEPLGGSYQERLEKRARQLEAEVERLSEPQKKLAKA
ncbi:MAG: hypothetical protein ACT4QA_00490 [Panacagrimonas sp.]